MHLTYLFGVVRGTGTTSLQYVMRKEIQSWKLPIWKKPRNCTPEYGCLTLPNFPSLYGIFSTLKHHIFSAPYSHLFYSFISLDLQYCCSHWFASQKCSIECIRNKLLRIMMRNKTLHTCITQ